MKNCAALIVEDDANVQQLLHAMLRKYCTSVATASDGEQAIELLRRESFDVVLLDLMLPKVNGLAVSEVIQTLPTRPRVIVLSAISRYFVDRLPRDTVILQKPFEIDRVVDVLKAISAV